MTPDAPPAGRPGTTGGDSFKDLSAVLRSVLRQALYWSSENKPQDLDLTFSSSPNLIFTKDLSHFDLTLERVGRTYTPTPQG